MLGNDMMHAYQKPIGENLGMSSLPTDQIKNDAICIVEGALEAGINSWNGEEDGLENVILNYADLGGEDETVSGDQQLHFDSLNTQIAHVLHKKGADWDMAQKAMIAGSDTLMEQVLSAARDGHNADNRPEEDSIGEYLESKIGSLYDAEDIEKIAENCDLGFGFYSPEDVGAEPIGEAFIKKIIGGAVKMVKKKVGKKKKMSAKQKAGLKKARRKANTGAAKRNRKKSMKIRKKRGMD